MRKTFDQWKRVRTQTPLDSLYETVADDVYKEGWRDALGWAKDKVLGKKLPDPASLYTDPTFQGRVVQFAQQLGLDRNPAGMTDALKRALTNIAAARVYGPKFGGIQMGDLALVWQQLQWAPKAKMSRKKGRVGPQPKTIAQEMGIFRPLAIPTHVPGVTTNQQYAVTQSAAKFDQDVRRQMAAGGAGGGAAAPEPAAASGSPPRPGGSYPGGGAPGYGPPGGGGGSDPLGDIGAPGSKQRQAIVAQIWAHLKPLQDKLDTGGTLNKAEMTQYRYWKKIHDYIRGVI